jgi:hypothetical protein
MIHDETTTKTESKCDAAKRDFIKKAAYAAPAIVSLQAFSAFAKAGSTGTVQPSTSVGNQRQNQLKKILCELNNRIRARQGLPPNSC